MRLLISFIIAFTFLSVKGFCQKGLIEGFIKDADSKIPLYGATVNIQTDKVENTDQFGRFNLQGINPGQYELIVSHIGYKTEIVPVEVKPNLQSTVNIDLKKNNLELSAVTLNSNRTNSLSTIAAVDIRLRPVNTSQDVLRIVPGLFIAQHAGGGKAEQIFLRGYDIDHGTDIAISVDGMPVNIVSHAHGQGYADLHFLIPEMVEKTDFDKGPYFASKGNLATAAYVDFKTKDFIETNSIKAEIGQFNARRLSGLVKIFNTDTEKARQQFYVASEYSTTDGYFQSPQKFHRFNLSGKYTAWFGNQSQLSVTASTFDSKWNASGQIPDRAVQNGSINRFGAIDDTEGGNTSRTNVNIQFNKQWKNNWKSRDQFYYSRYAFNLFSNFTFYLNDAVNGDMINQKEKRNIWGYNTSATKNYFLGHRKANTEIGAGFRYDDVAEIELAKANRKTFFNSLQKGDVKELNSFVYINQHIETGAKTNLNAGVRYDNFIFQYRDLLIGETSFRKQQKGIVSPKLNFSYSPTAKIKLYINTGIGFHSNDARVILNQSAKEILPAVYGTDIGFIAKPSKKLIVKTTLWQLYSKQEFVYVGDEGIIEPSGKAQRIGVDISARYQFTSWLFGDIDINFTKPRLVDEIKGENYIPLAPTFTSIGGITVKSKNGFSGSLRYRLIGNRPANETNTIKAQGYFIGDLLLNYRLKKFDIFVSAENILNTDWREAQFDTESRLKFETQPVSEIHYTPGAPRYFKAGVTIYF